MTIVAPPSLVEAPPIKPLAHGLFSVVDFRPSGRFETGIEWEPRGGTALIDGISAVHADVLDMTGLPKTLDGQSDPALNEAFPFTVYAQWKKSPTSFGVADAQAKANDQLAKWEQMRVEQALWTGDLLNDPNLQGANGSTAPTVLTEVKATYAGGLAALEDFLGSVLGQAGIIHMSRSMALLGIDERVLEVKSGRLQTSLGTPVVAGAGYPGTAPEGNPSITTRWVYATSPIIGYRSEVFESSNRAGDLFNQGTNDLYAIAERTYLLGYEQAGIGAVEVTI